MQVMCDSLVYVEADSAFDFFGEPVLWSEENQLTASQIRVIMKDQQLQRMEMTGVALVPRQKDSSKYRPDEGKGDDRFFCE